MNLIVIVGKKRTGKDVAAQTIVDLLGDCAKSYALADPIKKSLACAFDYWGVYSGGKLITFSDINGETDFNREMDLGVCDHDAREVLINAWSHVMSESDLYWDGISRIYDYLQENPDQPWSVRRFMQVFGTDIGVYVDKAIWMRSMANVYLDAVIDGNVLVITDCRQEHEIDILRSMGAKIIHIHREGFSDVVTDSHITERGLPVSKGDTVIENNGSLEEYKEKVKICLLSDSL